MPDLVLTFLLLGVPLLVGIAGCVLVWSSYSDLRSRPEQTENLAMARGRLPVFFALSALPFMFGLVPWFLLAGLELDYGALQGSSYTASLWMAAGFAAVAGLVVGSQTWLARARLREFVSLQFGRVLPVMVVPNTSLVFAMILCFLALGRLKDLLATPSGVSSTTAGEIALVFQVFALTAVGNPLGLGLSLRVRDITTAQGFIRTVAFADLAGLLSVVGLVWGFLQLGSV